MERYGKCENIEQHTIKPVNFKRFFAVLLTTLYYASTQVLDVYEWGKYIYFILAILILVLITFSNRKRGFVVDHYIKWYLAFAGYMFLSCIWSINSSNTVEKAITVLEIAIFGSIIYNVFYHENDLLGLVKVLIFGGYLVAIYLLFVYKVSGIRQMALKGIRFSGEYGNANSIAFFMMYSILSVVYEIFFCRIRVYHIGVLLCLFILIVSASRTAVIGTLLGIMVILYFKIISSDRVGPGIKFGMILVGVVLVVYILQDLPILHNITSRMDDLNMTLSGKSGDNSSEVRVLMIKSGFEQFKKHPLFGIGYGNAALVFQSPRLRLYGYYHNNYVELLVSGGIIGFLLFYYPHISSLIYYIKNRKYADDLFPFYMMILLVTLLVDYGTVSYYSKYMSIILAIMFLGKNRLKGGINQAVRNDDVTWINNCYR